MLKFATIYNLLKVTPLPENFIDKYTRKPIFIVGSQRSGTGFLMSVINQSKDICNWSEANYVWQPQYYDFWNGGVKTCVPDFIGKGIHAHEIPPKYEAETKQRVRKLFSLYLYTSGKNRLLHKNPYNSVRLDLLKELFPDSKVIHMERNPKATANSAINKRYPRPESKEIFLRRAVYRVFTCNQNFENFAENHPHSTNKIRYQDLGSDKAAKIISDLFDFLNLQISEEVFSHLNKFENQNHKYKKMLSAKEQQIVEDELLKLRNCDYFD